MISKKELKLKILVVDDDRNICKALGLSLKDTQCQFSSAHSVDEALTQIRAQDFDLILTDFKMEKKTGLELIVETKKIKPELLIVVMTAFASIENAISVVKEGAFDYLPKPFTNDQFFHLLRKVQQIINLKQENLDLKKSKVRRDYFTGLTSHASRFLEEIVKKIAPTNATILLTGESGTGKSELAKLIHVLSNRANGPFVTVYCTTLTESLLESELFGHVKGAFTGASTDKVGKLELAEGGTLFLDEVGDLSASGQTKLLRFLQDRIFERVGGNQEITVDTRVIAATNKDLKEDVADGKFREDLYFRLNALEFPLTSLRHRREDLIVHIERILKEMNVAEKIPGEVMKKLAQYHWPGNLRELRNCLDRLVMLSAGRTMGLEDLQPSILASPLDVGAEGDEKSSSGLHRSLEEVEKMQITKVLSVEKNFEKAAEILGITKATLWRKRKQYGLP